MLRQICNALERIAGAVEDIALSMGGDKHTADELKALTEKLKQSADPLQAAVEKEK